MKEEQERRERRGNRKIMAKSKLINDSDGDDDSDTRSSSDTRCTKLVRWLRRRFLWQSNKINTVAKRRISLRWVTAIFS